MRIQHNITALNAYRQLGNNNSNVSGNLEKLSSGYRINRAGDDAAGLAISEKMRSQITGLETASKNAEDGISMIQTAEGALTETHSMLNRMVELATQSANGTYGESERTKMTAEVTALNEEIDRIASSTNFNGKSLLNGNLAATVNDVDLSATGKIEEFKATVEGADGLQVAFASADGATLAAGKSKVAAAWTGKKLTITLSAKDTDATITQKDIDDAISSATGTKPTGAADLKVTIDSDIKASAETKAETGSDIDAEKAGLDLQVGDTNQTYQRVNVTINAMDKSGLGLEAVDVSDSDKAMASLEVINNAIEKVSTARSNLGALQNRLDHTVNNLGVTTENLSAAESRIRDVDMAKEMMDFTKNNILTQASQAMLATANQTPQGVLQLLQ